MSQHQVSNAQKKILIVEDDVAVIAILEEAIKSEGYTIQISTSGRDAVEKVKAFQPHLVVTDNDMPDMTGLEMLKELRLHKNYVTVIFISGRIDTQFVVEALKSGADDYIRKPFRISELIARIEVALRVNELHRDLLIANSKLQEMIDRDDLTGLYNMRSMYDKIDVEIKRAQRYQRNVACIMLDMDKFKSVNDDHDHLFGSFVLREVGKIIQSNIRDVDLAARYGGDEFLIVLTETNMSGLKIFSERLRSSIEKHVFESNSDKISLTCSLGYAIGGANDSKDARALVRAADHALYRAKAEGRNRVSS